jgi:UDP-N-acetylmuramate dehydrogenase
MLAIFDAYLTKMLKIHQNHSLKHNSTFKVDIDSSLFAEPSSINELEFSIRYAKERSLSYFIIGEGSNLLFTSNYGGLIIHPVIQGIEMTDESDSEVLVKAGAGVNWDTFVDYCVNKSWYGTENLSLIPGSVGAAPVQNIGAYGVEAKDIIEYVGVFDTMKMEPTILSNAACEFGYRDSIFKHGTSQHYIVTDVVFRLRKKSDLMLDYGTVKEEFYKNQKQNLKGLRETIISIRNSKLPDPATTGNAGSFFKNPVTGMDKFQLLQEKYGNVPSYPAGLNRVKVPAAWLIEKAGWKGVREGDVGTWPNQPLVIVNYGNASGADILNFSEKIRQSVLEIFSIDLEREVTVVA